MAKARDTNAVPERITAPWVKRFFRDHFDIPVRVRGADRDGWMMVWIMSDRSVDHRHGLVYHHEFPPELGNRCVKLTYPESEELCKQDWAGNVERHSISMHGHRFRELFEGIIANPLWNDVSFTGCQKGKQRV